MPKYTRRGFLGLAATAGASVAAIKAEATTPKQHETWSWNTGRETFDFIGLVHNAPEGHPHLYPPNPNSEFAQPVNAIFWEDVSPYLDPEYEKVYQAFADRKADDDFFMGSTLKYVKEK